MTTQGDAMKLWTVTVEVEMQVLADSSDVAQAEALLHLEEEAGMGNHFATAQETIHLPPEWAGAYPWGGDGTQTCQEILERKTL